MYTTNEPGFSHPNLTAHYMPRPRLDKLFDEAARSPLVYVIAGAGYGKTQTVRHYIEQQQDAVVNWIQLTESDNIGSRYWESLIHTISVSNPDLAVSLRELGFPETLSRFKQFAEMVRGTKRHLPKSFFVLDDFHLLQSEDALVFAERCAHLQLPGACLIIISRKEPTFNVAALHSKGKMSMITEDELRFTSTEAAAFFRQYAIPLSAEHISQLMDATKGWALAINMLVLLLKRTPNHFKHALDTVRQNTSKLFETEAWDRLPAPAQKALLKMSLLSDLPIAPLQAFTADIAFLQNTPGLASFLWFDSFTNDFKIHPLYLEFLQSKQHLLSHEEKQETYRQAADWCAGNDFYMDAMHYYAKSHQYERMVQTLLSYPFRLPRDVSEYFLNILENLHPKSGEQNDPNFLFLKSYFIPVLLAGAGRYREAQEKALAVIREWEHTDDPFAAVLLYTSYSSLPYINMYLCTVTHEYNSTAYLRKAVAYAKQFSIPPTKISGAFINADLRSFACSVGEGADLPKFDQFLEAAEQNEFLIAETPHRIYAGYADLVACEYAFFKNRPDLARNHAHNAILKARENRQYSIEALAEKYLLHIAMQEGNTSLVKKLLKQLCAHLDNPDFWNRRLYCDLYTGIFYARIGLPERVPQWLVTEEKETASILHIPVRELHIDVMYHIAAQKYQQALTILCNSHPRTPEERFLFGELRLLLLSAVARIQTGDTDGAMADFERAYDLSFQGVFELFFIELGKELHPLIIAALKRTDYGIPEAWLKAIDRKTSIYVKKVAVIAATLKHEANIKESASLSEREREVLLDLYHGLSREEIAVNRYLSVNTVKKTLLSVYTKLGAHNNVDAVRIALEQKLIE
ncbi:MAG: LuxR C-terminal-related transcriptional regulator [Oscillospiraceae bacterium]|nr:LuxR C-terminal-related transcriptional regulator [Oscillospiraceae bacterium]